MKNIITPKTPMLTRRIFPSSLMAALVVSVSACGGGGDSSTGSTSGSSGTTASTASTGTSSGTSTSTGSVSVSSFADTYTLKADDGTTATLVFDASGNVSKCTVGTVVSCSGRLLVASASSTASFDVTGNDGQKPVDTSATLSGTIKSDGTVSGKYAGSSKSDGSFSGAFSGKGTKASVSTNVSACMATLLGTWRSEGIRTSFTFNAPDTAIIVTDSLNYGANAQQWSYLSIQTCTSTALTYKITRARLTDTVPTSYSYDKTADANPTEADWTKIFTQPYTVSDNRFTTGGNVYLKQ